MSYEKQLGLVPTMFDGGMTMLSDEPSHNLQLCNISLLDCKWKYRSY